MIFLTKMLVSVPVILSLAGCSVTVGIQDKRSWLDENCVRVIHPKKSPYAARGAGPARIELSLGSGSTAFYECDHSLLDTD